MREKPQVDQPLPGQALATGRATFVDDIVVPNMLHAWVLPSPHPRARILSIDPSAAVALPGVVAILTHEDSPPEKGQGRLLHPEVRYVGDRVAAVAAEDPELAERACQAIRVEYEVLSPVLTVEAAEAAGAPRVLEDSETNVGARFETETGDIKRGFEEAERVFEGTYRASPAPVFPLEPRAVLTWLDEDSRLVVRCSTESPSQLRRTLAGRLEIPLWRIRVLAPRVGGSFGSRQEVLNEDLAALLTLRTGRPVRLCDPRGEELTVAPLFAEETVTVRSGVKDGRFTALEVRAVSNVGTSEARADALGAGTWRRTLSVYACPNRRFETRAVYTNDPPRVASRGRGWPQGVFALESHVEEVAQALGLDPGEFRKKNLVKEGDPDPFAAPGTLISSSGATKALEAGTKAVGWARRQKRKAAAREIGLGGAVVAQASSTEGSSVLLRVNEDASFHLFVGGNDSGDNSETVLCEIAAAALGIERERVFLSRADTDLMDSDASPLTLGSAIEEVSRQAMARIREVASERLGVSPSEVSLQGDKLVGPKGGSVSLADVGLRVGALTSASATKTQRPDPLTFAAVLSEVEVDTETGVIRVLKIVASLACGRVPDPTILTSQVVGAALRGLGYALSGGLLDPSLRLAGLPLAIDAPEIVSLLIPSEEKDGPYCLQADTEAIFAGVAPSIANAVADAVGARIRELPLSPDRVLRQVLTGRR